MNLSKEENWLANLATLAEIAEGSFEELAMQGCDFNAHVDAAQP